MKPATNHENSLGNYEQIKLIWESFIRKTTTQWFGEREREYFLLLKNNVAFRVLGIESSM